MNRKIVNLANIGIVVALLVLAANAWISFRNIRQLIDRDGWVQHTQQVLIDVERLKTEIGNAVAGERGFLLGGGSSFLDSYNLTRAGILGDVANLKSLTSDNPAQQQRLDEIDRLVRGEFDMLATQVSLRTEQNPGSITSLLQSKQNTDRLAVLLSDMSQNETQLLADRQALSRASYFKAVETFLVSTIVAIAMVIAGYALIRRDQSYRNRAAAEQNRLNNYNRLLVDSTGEGMYGVDLNGNCTFINNAAARSLKLDAATAIGRHMHELTHHTKPDGSKYPASECPIYQASRSGRGIRVDNELFWRSDASSFPVEYSAYPIRNEGQIEGVVVAFSDITLRKRSEEELKRAKDEAEAAKIAADAANVAKSQFLANMSHELRTPLNAVIMYSELLQEEAVDRKVESFIPDLEKIRSGGKHLLALVNGVLDLSKIEAGKMDLYLETFDVRGMIEDVITTVRPVIDKKANKLSLEIAGDIGSMHADLTKVRQILFNLISNAAKFTDKGAITIAARREVASDGEWIEMQVKDTGIGMSPQQQDRLFQPFMQADESTTRKFGGTGLGLSITRRFCQIMGGDVLIQSEPGAGSTFTVRLPARVSKPLPASEPVIPTTNVTAPGATRVLVIDDEANVRDLMSRWLSSEGIGTVTAADGEDGLAKARELQPDVIFLDVMMPRMDGWAVLTALKADAILCEIPVIMLTIVSDKEMGYLLGASEYLVKPIDRDRLTTLIDKYRSKNEGRPVLVVDDDEATRKVLTRTLTKQGRTVIEAENGKVALERCAEHHPGLILLDLAMPVMDGFEFLALLRQDPLDADVPVVVLTSKDLSPQERAQLNGRVETILEKGAYSRDMLIREVKQIVARVAPKPQVSAATVDVAQVSSNVSAPAPIGPSLAADDKNSKG